MEQAVSVKGVDFSGVFFKISGWGTHHGRCRRGHDGVGKGGEGVLVCVLMCVLVLMLMLVLMLVELSPQVWRGTQRCPAISTLRRQETSIQFLPEKILF